MLEAPPRSAAVPKGIPSWPVRVFVTLVVVAFALIAIALAIASFASYGTVKHRLDAYASDHDANFSRARFHTVVWQVRLLAAVLACAGAAAHIRRRRLAQLAEALLQSTRAEGAELAVALRRTVAAESRLHLVALGAISVVALLVRLDFLFQPMRYDESVTYVHYASRPLYVGLTTYTAPNNHVLNTVLVHLSTELFGNHPWAIRLPAFTAGVLLVPATYVAARIVYDRGSGLLAAALVATSSTLIEYSTNGRGYTGLTLIFILLLALATHLRQSRSSAAWAAFAVLAALGFFEVPTMLYAFGAVVVWLAWSITVTGRTDLLLTRLLPALAASGALTVLLYAPVIAVSGPHSLLGNSFVAPQTWSYFTHHLPRSLEATFARWHRDQPPALWILLACGFVVAIVLHQRLSEVKVPPVVGPLVFIPPVIVLQHVVPFERVWLFLLPLYLMTAAAGVLFLVRRFRSRKHYAAAVSLIAVALCVSLARDAVASRAVYHSEDTSTFRDAPHVAAFLEQYVRPGDRVLVSPPADAILEYYLSAEGLDPGRLLYTDFAAKRLLVVVKEGPREYTLSEVLRQHLSGTVTRRLTPVPLRRYPHTRLYELVRRHSQRSAQLLQSSVDSPLRRCQAHAPARRVASRSTSRAAPVPDASMSRSIKLPRASRRGSSAC
jgi:uncharacterized membrane protein